MQIRLLPLTIIILLVIALIAATVFFAVQFYLAPGEAQASKQQVEQLLEKTSEPLEVTTNLADDTYIKLEVIFEVSSENTKKELDSRMFQIKDALIALLQNRSHKDVHGEKGLDKLKEELQERVDTYLTSGEVEHIYVTERVTQ